MMGDRERLDEQIQAEQERQDRARERLIATAGQWIAEVRAWAASYPQHSHVADDSRESIYGDRV